MKNRVEAKITNPHIRVNYDKINATTRTENSYRYNNHGSIVDVTQNVAQYGDVKVWCKALNYTAAQFAELVGRSKSDVIRWLKNPDSDKFTDLTNKETDRVFSKINERTHKLTVSYYDNGTVKEMFCL